MSDAEKTIEQLYAEIDQLKSIIRDQENSLSETRSFTETLLNASPDIIYVYDIAGSKNIYSNEGIEKILGYTADEIKEMGKELIPALMHPNDFQKYINTRIPLYQNAKDGEIIEHEYRMKHKNGSWHWLSSKESVFKRLPNGEPSQIFGILSDITERRQAESELLSEKERIKTILDSVADPIFVKDNEHRITLANRAFCRMFGMDEKSVIGFTLAETVPENEREQFLRVDRKVLDTGIPDIREEELTIGQLTRTIITKKICFEDESGKRFLVGSINDITERIKAEESLRESEKKLKDAQRMATLGFWNWDIKTGEVEWSDEVYKIFHLDPANFKPQIDSIMKLSPWPEENERNNELIQKCIESRNPGSYEQKILRPDESVGYYFSTFQGIYDGKDDLIRIKGTVQDITERKKAEEKLRISEERFKIVAESAEEWVWEVDKEGLYTYSSPMVENILGYKPEEIVGKKHFYDFFQEDIREQYNTEAFRVFDQKLEINDFENANVHKNGQIVILKTNGSPILDKKGNLIGFRGVDTNITQIKQNEEALLYEKYLLHSLMDNSLDNIYFKDINSCFIRINNAQAKLFGLSNPEEAVGKKDSDFFTEEHSSDAYNDEQEIISTGRPVVNKEEMETLKNGEISWVNSTKLPLRDSYGKIIGTFGISRDITEQKKTEQELIDALKRATSSDRLKSAFLANMSHEIRTPMNGILGFTSLLKEHDLSGEQQNEYIDIIQKSGNRMLNTVNDIIEISRIEAGEVRISSDTLNINNHLIDLFNFFVPEAENKGLKLIIDKLPEDELVVSTDKNKLSSIVTNLIKNAIKFTDVGTIKIGCKKNEKFLKFYVEDTGIGIPGNRKDAIFNRFEQADIEDTRVYEGSGLGLAIVKYYVEMLGGKIWVESEENKGSTFFFTISYQPFNTKDVLSTTSGKKLSENKRKLKILVVEDDETSFLYLSTILNDLAEKIQLAKNGLEAVEFCENNSGFDIVLMDIKLPVLDGFKATKKIREFNKEIKIIAQTAYALEGDKEKAIEIGCNDYISKPINKGKLIEMIGKHF